MAKLKATDLDDAQLMEVAQFDIAENLTVAAIATDSRIFTAKAQGEWRRRQVRETSASSTRSSVCRRKPFSPPTPQLGCQASVRRSSSTGTFSTLCLYRMATLPSKPPPDTCGI